MTRILALCALLLAVPLAHALALPAGFAAMSADDKLDHLVRAGYDHPDAALSALDALRSASAPRAWLQAAATIQAQAGRAAQANALAEQLLALAHDGSDPLAGAAANLVRAIVAESAGQPDVAAALAQSALTVYQAHCPARPADPAACDHRSLWRALQLLQQRAVGLGLTSAASAHARSALAVAEAADDAYRQSLSLATLALLSAREGSQDTADQALARAKRSAATVDDPLLSVRVRNIEAAVADLRGDRATTLRLTEESLGVAERVNATRVSAQLMVNLTDLYAKLRRPADALRSADRALPIVRSFHDARSERVLINNAGLAKIGLGRVAEGKQDMARVLELSQRDASLAYQAQTLTEFGEALAAAGEARDALALYRRERALTVEFMQRDRAAALREIQARYHTEAEQRSISLRARDNALKDATLANRDLQQRIWMLLAAVLALAVTLAALLYRRVRETHRQLEASQARLRLQSQRDPLTNLANRSHFHSMIDELSARRGAHFEGTLLMVDIDHFKAVNDGHGHAAGDEVLVEMARRLNDAVRDSDMVVRWGGEEFLIVSLQVTAEQAHRMAERMLASIAGTPMIAGGQTLRITASIGYGRFPLPPHHVGATWEQAVNLVDMALYTAKNQGRNRAMGIVNASAIDAAALHAIEADFERARSDGRVVLQQTLGPDAIRP